MDRHWEQQMDRHKEQQNVQTKGTTECTDIRNNRMYRQKEQPSDRKKEEQMDMQME